MTALSGSSLSIGYIGESTNPMKSSTSIVSSFSSRLPLLNYRAVKTASDGAGLHRKPIPAVSRPEDSSKEVVSDWDDRILAETVPLVNFARMILHSGRYKDEERLSPEHEKAIVEKLLPYHPEYERKIGGGIKYIKVGCHPEYDGTRCMLVVWKNGEEIDFSYRKCIKGLIRRKYPLHAESFIFRHLRSPKRRPV